MFRARMQTISPCKFLSFAWNAFTILTVIVSIPYNLNRFAMSGDGNDDVKIPSVFLYSREKEILMKAISENPNLEVEQIDHESHSQIRTQLSAV